MCIEYNVALSFLSVQGKHSVNLAEKKNKDNDINDEEKVIIDQMETWGGS